MYRSGGRCSQKSWVFKSFLKVERDAPALVVIGSSFHQRGTTNENSLILRMLYSAKRHDLETGDVGREGQLVTDNDPEVSCCFGWSKRSRVSIDLDVVVDDQ